MTSLVQQPISLNNDKYVHLNIGGRPVYFDLIDTYKLLYLVKYNKQVAVKITPCRSSAILYFIDGVPHRGYANTNPYKLIIEEEFHQKYLAAKNAMQFPKNNLHDFSVNTKMSSQEFNRMYQILWQLK